jgi:hypothetical protein
LLEEVVEVETMVAVVELVVIEIRTHRKVQAEEALLKVL